MIEPTGAAVAALLAGAWRQQASRDVPIDAAALRGILPLLEESGAAGLAWWRIRESSLVPSEDATALRNIFWYQAVKSAVYADNLRKLFDALNERGIRAIMAKGWAAARYYAEAALRPYGDIDLLVAERDAPAVAEMLRLPHLRAIDCDLHTRFSDLEETRFDALFERAESVTIGSTQVRVLSAEDHLGLFCVHFVRHLAWRPIWLCDVAAATESVTPGFDWDVCLGGAERSRWVVSVLQLARHLLGARSPHLPPAVAHAPPRWLVRWVVNEWGKRQNNRVLFPRERVPLLRSALEGSGLWHEMRARWPDPISAVQLMNGRPDAIPPVIYQASVFTGRACRYVARLCAGQART